MKRNIALFAAAVLLVCTGCSDSEKKAEKPQVSPERNIVLTVDTSADVLKCAHSLEELSADSDFIAKVKITESTAKFLDDGSQRVATEMQPEVIEIYKGEYNGEKLSTVGGIVKITEYSEVKSISRSEYSDEEWKNGYVEYNWMNNYIPQVGDEIIFFGRYSQDDGLICNMYEYQGIFLCDGENATIKSLEYLENDDWYEKLGQDLVNNYDGNLLYNDSTVEITCTQDTIITAIQ